MKFEKCLCEQLALHPVMQPRDVVKHCYQAAFGAEHLLKDMDIERVRDYLTLEYEQVRAEEGLLYEALSEDISRIQLSAWKQQKLPVEWLLQMFISGGCTGNRKTDLFEEYLRIAGDILKKKSKILFTEWETYLSQYRQEGMPAVHHSETYRQEEKPAYRIVNNAYLELLPVLQSAAKVQREKGYCIVAIEGRAAAGKSTLAKRLKNIMAAEVIAMDDFFLPKELRTKERLDLPGGNIHYERFQKEVLPYLKEGEAFSYQIFDCSRGGCYGERRIKKTNIYIVEGSYSLHPALGEYSDVQVFADVEPKIQMERILARNGQEMAEVFREKWIPMEEQYFSHYHIQNRDRIIAVGLRDS